MDNGEKQQIPKNQNREIGRRRRPRKLKKRERQITYKSKQSHSDQPTKANKKHADEIDSRFSESLQHPNTKARNASTQLFDHVTTQFAQISKSWRLEISETLECSKPRNSKHRKVMRELLGQPAFHDLGHISFTARHTSPSLVSWWRPLPLPPRSPNPAFLERLFACEEFASLNCVGRLPALQCVPNRSFGKLSRTFASAASPPPTPQTRTLFCATEA